MLTARDAKGQRFPASALETWLDLRALAWGQQQTESLDFGELKGLLGKGRSTVLGHLALLRDWFGQRWVVRSNKLTVYFDDAGEPADRVQESGSVQKAGPAPVQETPENKASPESRTLDSVLKELNTRDSSELKEGEAVQKPGLQSRNLDSAQRRRLADPRSKSAAIQACRKLTNRYPDLTLYDRILAAIGDTPDEARLAACRTEWIERGLNPNSWKWATEWYVSGIPQQGRPPNGGSQHANRRGPEKHRETDRTQLERDRQLKAERDARRAGR